MLVLCGRRWGLVCSITRLISFGALPDDLRRKAEAVARVDAALIAASRPGNSLSQVFQQGVNAYAINGFSDEWKLHHQGGPAGYEPREYLPTPTSKDQVVLGQAYAWNPSITGTNSEDTILATSKGLEIITRPIIYPTLSMKIAGIPFTRPAILEK